MKEQPQLEHFDEFCDNFSNCLQDNNNMDCRTNDTNSFQCALYSFCPDPCCPIKHLKNFESCWNSPINPCYVENVAKKRQCTLKRSENTNFR